MQFSQELIHLLANAIEKNGWIDLPAEGNSMFPFIQKGNICRFIPCDTSTLKRGDIVLFYTSTGRLVAHRFYELKLINYKTHYIFKGDTNMGLDEPVNGQQIIGRLEYIRKEKKQIHAVDLVALMWGKLILFFPIFSRLLRMYLNYKNSVQT